MAQGLGSGVFATVSEGERGASGHSQAQRVTALFATIGYTVAAADQNNVPGLPRITPTGALVVC